MNSWSRGLAHIALDVLATRKLKTHCMNSLIVVAATQYIWIYIAGMLHINAVDALALDMEYMISCDMSV